MAGKVIGIVSPKGGVGKTTVASSLGVLLAKEHEKPTILVDMNYHTPNVFHYLGLDRHPELTTNLNKMLKLSSPHLSTFCSHSSGLHVVPTSIDFHGEKNISTDRLRRNLNNLKQRYDYVILDSPPGIGKTVKQVIGVSDDVVVVTTPDTPSVISTVSAIRLAKALNTNHHVIINKATGHKYELRKGEVEKMLNASVIGEIPFEFNVMSSAFKGMPATYSSNGFKNHMGRISEHVTGEIYSEETFFERLTNLFRL
ncbi:AAA family ATPase [archaeon]|nr:AAA family ATPase [archaeon]